MTVQVVIHVSAPWERFHRRPLIEALAKVGRGRLDVLIVDRPLDLVVAPLRRRSDLWNWLTTRSWRTQRHTENLRVLKPFVPLHEHLAAKNGWLANACERVLQAQVEKEMPRVEGVRRIEWIYYPEQAIHLRRAGETFAVYECYDEYNADPVGGGARRKALEDDLLRRADLVLTTASDLWEARRERHPNVRLIPNAVDYERLSEAQAPGALHPEFEAIPGPRIGFLGYFNQAVDLPFLEAAVGRESGWSWIFIGPPGGADEAALARLRALPNTHFLGYVPHGDLAPVLRGLSVGIIPFNVEGAYHQAINPLKLYEYMAAGLPVVSTALREVARFAPPVILAETVEEFLTGIRRLLNDEAAWQEARERGDLLARQETWEVRATQILAHLEEGLIDA